MTATEAEVFMDMGGVRREAGKKEETRKREATRKKGVGAGVSIGSVS